MRSWTVAALALAGCASSPVDVPLLAERPEQPYRELGRIHASGPLGAPREEAYERLRAEAAELGADAVIRTGEARKYRRRDGAETVEDRASLGDAYPDPVEAFRPGYFGYEGSGVATVAGYAWIVEGTAIDLQEESP